MNGWWIFWIYVGVALAVTVTTSALLDESAHDDNFASVAFGVFWPIILIATVAGHVIFGPFILMAYLGATIGERWRGKRKPRPSDHAGTWSGR